MSLVLDCSVTLAWCFEDEASPAVDAIMRQVGRQGAYVPSIWALEVANGFRNGIRRHRFDEFRRTKSMRLLSLFDIRTDDETALNAWGATTILSDQHQLTLYDASYLELAVRRSLPLAGLDADLCRAAKRLGLMVLGH